jgi:undecaprenyl-diphosphatase
MGPTSHAMFLGVLQGLTEFLPVSSDGHLALATLLFDIDEGGLTLSVLLHAGTLLATLVVLRHQTWDAVSDGAKALAKPSRFRETKGGRDALVVLLATLPTGIIGLALRNAVERWTLSPLVVGLGFVGTAVALISTRWVIPGDREHPSLVGALLIGLFQGFAVLPGLSRSASTIALALWLKVRPERAFELSMLMSLPAVLGAVLLEGRHLLAAGGPVGPAAAGACVAFVVGVVALYFLRRVVMRGHFSWFAFWVLPLALATLALARVWPKPGTLPRAEQTIQAPASHPG